MARPNSRYFAPVIKKFVEAKRNENIFIDEQFKASLKSEIMLKIAASGEVGKSDVHHEGFLDSLEAFLKKWRYALAVVPSALVLVLVVVQAMKLPIQVKNDTTIPLQTKVSQELSAQTSQQMTDSQESLRPKIVTFAGSSVMPSKPNSDLQQFSEYQPPKLEEVVQQPEQKQNDTAVQPPSQLPTATQNTAVQYQIVQPTAPAIISQNITANTVTPAEDAPEQARLATPTELPQSTAPILSGSSQPSLPAEKVETDESVMPIVADPKTQQAPLTQPSASMVAPLQNLNNTVTSPLPYAIYYNGHFPEEERTAFETTIVLPLLKGKEIFYVAVTEQKDGLVAVEIHLKNNVAGVHYFKKNIQTNTWQEIEYATHYYFDNSLSYERH